MLSHFRRVRLCNAMDCGRQAPLPMEFSRQEYWSGLPFPPPGDLPNPGIEPRSPALQADSLPSEPLRVKKKKKVGSLKQFVRAGSMKCTWISLKALTSLGCTAGLWRSGTWIQWLGRKALESDQCGLESQLRIIPENENGPDK